jgi:histidinol-phosphate aminotransferase
MSKAYSLAGLRVGFALGHPDLIQGLDRVKNSFNSYPLDRLALAGAQAAVLDQTYFEQARDAVVRSRDALTDDLRNLGFEVLPSAANFVFVRHPAYSGETLASALRTRNILVRHFKLGRISNHLRITVGTDEECKQLVIACREILK